MLIKIAAAALALPLSGCGLVATMPENEPSDFAVEDEGRTYVYACDNGDEGSIVRRDDGAWMIYEDAGRTLTFWGQDVEVVEYVIASHGGCEVQEVKG